MKNSSFNWRLLLLWIPPLTFLALFYFFPLGSILEIGFARSKSGLAGPFLEALASPTLRNVLWFTLWQAALSTILTLLVGLPGAYLLARYEFRGKSLLLALTSIPFVMPTLVVAAAFNALLGPRGLGESGVDGLVQPEPASGAIYQYLHGDPGGACLLQPVHRAAHGGRFLVAHRPPPGAGCHHAGRLPHKILALYHPTACLPR